MTNILRISIRIVRANKENIAVSMRIAHVDIRHIKIAIQCCTCHKLESQKSQCALQTPTSSILEIQKYNLQVTIEHIEINMCKTARPHHMWHTHVVESHSTVPYFTPQYQTYVKIPIAVLVQIISIYIYSAKTFYSHSPTSNILRSQGSFHALTWNIVSI